MRRNSERIIGLRCDLINEIKDFIYKQGAERLEFTTTFNVGVEEIEFEDDYQTIMKTAMFITVDGWDRALFEFQPRCSAPKINTIISRTV